MPKILRKPRDRKRTVVITMEVEVDALDAASHRLRLSRRATIERAVSCVRTAIFTSPPDLRVIRGGLPDWWGRTSGADADEDEAMALLDPDAPGGAA